MITRIAIALSLLTPVAHSAPPEVAAMAAPNSGLQPVAEVDTKGNVHLIYFRGDAAHGDIYHTVRQRGSQDFSEPIKVNSIDGSAIAIGTIRGAQLALGRDGNVHIAWMGSSKSVPEKGHTPMLYTRSTDGGKSFERERNLITKSYGLDGGGSVAADGTGSVEVFWHAGKHGEGEAARQIWVTRSDDGGKTFAPEVSAWSEATGVCGCCGMTAGSSGDQSWVLYRSATNRVHRDIYLLRSDGKGAKFTGERLDQWEIEACPMSAMSLGFAGDATIAAWEAKGGDIAFSIVGSTVRGRVVHGVEKRKYPDVALAPDGHFLLTWIDGAGWKKGGRLGWQLFDPNGKAIGLPKTGPATDVWTKPTTVFDGESFLIIH